MPIVNGSPPAPQVVTGPQSDGTLVPDLVLIGTCLVILIAILAVVFTPGAALRDQPEIALPPVIGTLIQQTSDVRRRTDGMLVWNAIARGEVVRDGDGIYVGEGAAATVRLRNGAEISIDDRSMVVLHPAPRAVPAAGMAIDLVHGGAATVSSEPLAIRTAHAAVHLNRGSHAQVRLREDDSLTVAVPQGGASVQVGDGPRAPIAAQQRRRIAPAGGDMGAAEAMGPQLLEPETAARFYGPQTATVTFSWESQPHLPAPLLYTLELSATADFQTLSRVTSRSDHVAVPLPPPGIVYWRVRAASRQSETRQLVVVRDQPPALLTPRGGETVDLSQPAPAYFSWLEVPEAHRYLVEIIDEGGTVLALRTTQPRLRLPAQRLREANYCYRVRVDEADRGVSPWSPTVCFRALKKPILKAPKLFEPQAPPPTPSARPPQHGWLWRLVGGVARAASEAPLQAILLRWETITGAAAYVVEVATDAAFTRVVSTQRVPESYLRWQPPALQDYFWRVHAIDGEGRQGELSDPLPLILVGTPPEVQSPGADTTVWVGKHAGQVTLRWAGHGPTNDFWVELGRDPQLSVVVHSELLHQTGTWSFKTAQWGDWYYRVVQYLDGGRRGPATAARRLSVRPLPPDALTAAPSPGTGGLELQLHWNSRPVGGYEVQVSRDRSMHRAATVLSPREAAVAWRPEAAGAYFWRVRCKNPSSDWSAVAGISWTPEQPQELSTETPPPADMPDAAAPQPPHAYVAGMVGVLSNLGLVTAVVPAVGGGVRSHVAGQHLGAAIAAGFYTASTRAPGAAQRGLQGRLFSVPIDVRAEYLVPTPWVDVMLALGVRCALGYATVAVQGQPTWHSADVAWGGLVLAGAERAWGPGAVCGELSYALTTRPNGLVQHDAGGLGLALGYRMRVF